MRRWVLSGVSFVLLFVSFLVGSSATFASSTAPDVPVDTLPMTYLDAEGHTQPFTKIYGGNSTVYTTPSGKQYVQVTPAADDQFGAVWFDKKAISFANDFNIEMYVYISSGGSGDGMAVLLKDPSSPQWIGGKKAGTLAVYGPEAPSSGSDTDKTAGAITKSFAVEFDNYYNNGKDNGSGMDYLLGNSANHIAYSWPGLASSYTTDNKWLGPIPYSFTNHLKHYGTQFYSSLANGQWKKFTMDYQAKSDALTYTYDEGIPVTVTNFARGTTDAKGNPKDKFISNSAYLGFAGATGKGAIQEMSVAFTKVPNVLTMSMNQQISIDNDAPFFDSSVSKDQNGTVASATIKKKDSVINYKTNLVIAKDSSLPNIGRGSFYVTAPEGIKLDPASFKLDGQGGLQVTGSAVTSGDGKQETVYKVVSNKDLTTDGKNDVTYTLTYTGIPQLGSDGTLAVTNRALVELKGATFGDVSLPTDTSNNPLKYQIKAVAQPALSQTVTKITQTGETEVYNSVDDDPSDILLTSQKDQLKRSLTVQMKEGSTITDVGNAIFTIQATAGLNIDKASFIVNNTAIPAGQITEANGTWTIDTNQPVKIGSSVIIEYLMTPAWETNTNTVRQLDLTATVKADICELTQENLQVPVIQKATPTITLKTKADVLPAPTASVPAVAFADLAKGQWQAISINKDLSFVDSVDQDENSTDMQYYLKALPDTQEYHPDTDPGVKFADRTGRTALNDGSPQPINGMKIPKAEIAKIGTGKHYVAIYATDHEGNLSNVQYLKLNILSDKLTLDKVPDLSFDDEESHLFNSNDIAALADQTDTRDYVLKQDKAGFQMTSTKFLGFDGFIDPSQDKAGSGEILVTDARTDRTKGWVLTLDVPDITEAKANGRSLSSEAGIVLQLGINGKDPVNILYGKYGDATTQELTLKQQGNTAQTITANKTVEIAKGDGNTTVSDIIGTKVSIDPATTYLRIKKGSQNDFTKKATFQLQLHWVLKTVE